MSIKAICPECQTVYQLADQQAGKKVRCKQCQAVFVAAEASRQTAIRGEGNLPSQARTKPSPLTTQRRVSQGVVKQSALPWILGGVAAVFGLLLLLCGGVIIYLLLRDKPGEMANTNMQPSMQMGLPPPMPMNAPPLNAPPPAPVVPPDQQVVPPPPQTDNQPIEGQPVAPPAAANTDAPREEDKQAAAPSQAPSKNEKRKTEQASEQRKNKERLSAEGREHAKRATVYLRVTLADGTQVSGSGFFGCKEAPNIVLTNAHVVGMLAPESARPQSVEVVVNSGEANEWKTTARVLGVDRSSDLAVLDIGNTPPQPVPEPLTVKSADNLRELDEVYVFGFPLGERLGKEISMRRASVSALRRKNGVLERVQVEGGMDPGNSGGPVVDTSGAVIGVAVSGIPGHQINFAIPGERVHNILNGRISDLVIHQPYFTNGNKVAVPVVVDMIDPRNLIKEVGLEVWTGDKPVNTKAGNRPPSTTQPVPQPGDSPHVYYKLRYIPPEGKAEIVLPELPPGKVYWQQPRWVNSQGQTYWAAANPIKTLPQPVYRKPVNNLVLRYTQGTKKILDLTIENIFKVSNDDDADAFRVRTAATLTESVASTGGGGTQLNLRYKFPPHREIILPDGQSFVDSRLEQFKDDLPRLITSVVQLDRLGNITRQYIDNNNFRLQQLAQTNPQQFKSLTDFHEMIQQGLESLSVSLPASGSAKPLEGWKAERHLPIDTPGRIETGKLDVTFTYLGTRKRDGREEAVISMGGLVRGKDDAVGGRADGQILVDLANGQTLLAETTVKLQLKALLSRPGEPLRELRVLAIMKFRMQRKMQL
jgi:predicted Zn finger-like uncharacterized protein